jgi:hypothetical protein
LSRPSDRSPSRRARRLAARRAFGSASSLCHVHGCARAGVRRTRM